DGSDGREECAHDPASDASAGEVARFRQKLHAARRAQRNCETVDEREVVTGEDDRSGLRYVVTAGDDRAVVAARQGSEDEATERIDEPGLLRPLGRGRR